MSHVIARLAAKYREHTAQLKYLGADLLRTIVRDGTVTELEEAIQNGYPLYPSELDDSTTPKFSRSLNVQRAAIHDAAIYGRLDMFLACLRLGMPMELKDGYGGNIFHHATIIYRPEPEIYEGKIAILRTMVQIGSDAIDQPDMEGRTPLIRLLQCLSNYDVTRMAVTLFQLGSQAINTPDNRGFTPMDRVIERILFTATNNTSGPDWRMYTLFRALGATHNRYIDFENRRIHPEELEERLDRYRGTITDSLIESLLAPLDETIVANIRFDIYFQQSLLDRLLFVQSRPVPWRRV